jgi:hypothetical protein
MAKQKTKNIPLKVEDGNPKSSSLTAYDNAEEVLREIHRYKTGIDIAPDVLARIRGICEGQGVTLTQYVEELQPHLPNHWINPPGFLTDFARKIHQKIPNGTRRYSD